MILQHLGELRVDNRFSFFFQKHEEYVYFLFILLFVLAIFFTFSFRRGIEFTRYALIALTLAISFLKTNYLKQILHNNIFIILLLFIVISSASLLYNNHNLAKIDDAVNWTLWYIFGFIVSRILKDDTILILFFIPIFLFLCQISYPFFTGTLIGNLNFLNGNRLDLFFSGKPIHLGIFAGISTLTALYIFIKFKNKYIRIIYFLLTISSFLVLLSTGTRTSFVGTTAAIAITLFYFFYKKIRPSHLVIAALSFLTIASLFMMNNNGARISSLSDSKALIDSIKERELIFIIAKDSFFRSPLIGEGYDRFSEIYQDNIKKYLMDEKSKEKYKYVVKSSNNAHNFSLHFLTETGILGFLCMNTFWILIIFNGLKHGNDTTRIISGIFFLSYIAFQFNMSLYGNQMSTLLFSLAGLSGATMRGSKNSEFPSPDNVNFLLARLKASR
jgi:O-antigen ligase